MEKIEIKHLAPYLPYGIECITTTNVRGKMVQLNESSVFLDCDIKWQSGALYNWMLECDIKPILRPLSDLYNAPSLCRKHDISLHEGEFVDVYGADYCESPVAYVPVTDINWWLFENHFDVFGLIEAGLAIDINTIK